MEGISALSCRTNRSGAIHRAFHFPHRGGMRNKLRRYHPCGYQRHHMKRKSVARAVISDITWKEYLHDTLRHHDSLRMRYLHYPVAQTVAARFIAHFISRTMAECAINCAATTRAVISGITWKEYQSTVRLSAASHGRNISQPCGYQRHHMKGISARYVGPS
ncbi:hypothetical protein [Pantoea dispersa]|uniref:hypothetical protein n=1 Tax=Pantoea dispersa TaxID=59814 RepID=UPI001EE71D7B|nr:hypothetical protein [Pantoea dispersa]UKY35751.1 hypothetical protein KFZ74_15710 [Pantoea dispersa]